MGQVHDISYTQPNITTVTAHALSPPSFNMATIGSTATTTCNCACCDACPKPCCAVGDGASKFGRCCTCDKCSCCEGCCNETNQVSQPSCCSQTMGCVATNVSPSKSPNDGNNCSCCDNCVCTCCTACSMNCCDGKCCCQCDGCNDCCKGCCE